MAGESDPYIVLGVSTDASTPSIAAAYRALARKHHPDVSGDLAAERRMAAINAAWSILRDPTRRAKWDREHLPAYAARTHASAPRTGHSPSPSRSSTWGGSGASAGGWQRGAHGQGAAGPPPGNPRGSVLTFGRHIGWSLGEIARVDPGYLQWLATHRDGGRYRTEIEALLESIRPRPEEPASAGKRRGLFR